VTEDECSARKFTTSGSAIVLHNASTSCRAAKFGLVRKIRHPTGKFHARGPVGAAQLTRLQIIASTAPTDPAVKRKAFVKRSRGARFGSGEAKPGGVPQ